MLTGRITEGENLKWEATVMVISVCFSWVLDPYTFTLNFVCCYLFITVKENCDLILLVMF